MSALIEHYEIELVEPGCSPGAGRWGALAILDNDISRVFPYLNAVFPNAQYDHQNQVLIWQEQGQSYALRPKEIRVANVEDFSQAQQIISKLVDKINDLWQGRDDIVPRFKQRKLVPVIEIYKLLPKTNCR